VTASESICVKAMLSRRSCLGRESLGLAVLCLLVSAVYPSMSRAQAPVFVIAPEHSSIKFHVKASVTYRWEIRQMGCRLNICLS
jgi:hypothetical protein